MVFDILDSNGMKVFTIVSEIWDSYCASWNLEFWYFGTEIEIGASYPISLMDTIEKMYNLKLKLPVTISFHIWCDFFCGSNGILYFPPLKYIKNIVQTYMTKF